MPTTNTYIASGNISVFPCGNRQGLDILARLNTEYNLVSIINKLVDMKSFCVTSSVSTSGDFLFNVGGYLFNTDVSKLRDLLGSVGDYLYAGICVGKNDADSKLLELLPLLTFTDDANVDMDTAITTTDNSGNSTNVSNFVGVTFITHNALIKPGELGEGWILIPPSGTSTNAIFNSIVPTTKTIATEKYILPILYKKSSTEYSVPQVSLVKMSTTKEGNRRSVTIDDGELS